MTERPLRGRIKMAAIILSENGISIQSFQELREDLRSDWINAFGSSSLDLSPTTPDGHHLDLECKTITSISQIIEAVVNNLDRSTASGFWLDILAKFQNLTRKSATTVVSSYVTTVLRDSSRSRPVKSFSVTRNVCSRKLLTASLTIAVRPVPLSPMPTVLSSHSQTH